MKILVNTVTLFVLLFGSISIAVAVSDREICTQEAEDAGMTDPQEMQEYIEQCLAEIDQNREENWDDRDDHVPEDEDDSDMDWDDPENQMMAD